MRVLPRRGFKLNLSWHQLSELCKLRHTSGLGWKSREAAKRDGRKRPNRWAAVVVMEGASFVGQCLLVSLGDPIAFGAEGLWFSWDHHANESGTE